MDNPKKKKLDGKRVALTQKHEVAYIKRAAQRLMVRADMCLKHKERTAYADIWKDGDVININFPVSTIRKLCQALLKLL